MKVSLLTQASGNCFSRAYFLAKALAPHYEVEILGLTDESGIWSPFDTSQFSVRTVPYRRYPAFLGSAREALRQMSGDVVYALKPRPSTFGVALLKKVEARRPVILDMDDWEVGLYEDLPRLRLVINSLLPLWKPDDYAFTALTEYLVRFADQVTVVSDFLQRRFGGVKVPHGRDVHWLDPARHDRRALRQEYGLEGRKVITWLGTPRRHKGIDDLADALALVARDDVCLLIVGAERDDEFLQHTYQVAGRYVRVEGMCANSDLPRFLAMADLVVVPQRRTLAAVAQIPAKIVEAMAMARPIISTRVSDIPQMLDGCGVVVEPGNVKQLADAIARMFGDEQHAAQLGLRAREKCIREFSMEAMSEALAGVFQRYA